MNVSLTIQQSLHHLYINPLEKCNLHCAMCYTRKTDPKLSENQILDFIHRYTALHPLETITFCGGEVFLLPYFPHLVNTLTDEHIFVQIITNGTIEHLEKLKIPNSINLIVSIDGLEQYHDANRGQGNFRKSIDFLKNAISFGFHTEIFSIATKQNIPYIDEFEKEILHLIGREIPFTYHPRKNLNYLLHHPISNIQGSVAGFDYLNETELTNLMQTKNTFPPKDFGCYQISLVSDGSIYACCEGTHPIGCISDDIIVLIRKYISSIKVISKSFQGFGCLGCSYPEFYCGLKKSSK